MYGSRLTRDYGVSVPDVWRSAISSLRDHEIQRGLRRLAGSGGGSAPTLPQFMKACRQIGEEEGPSPQANSLPPPNFDRFHAFGNRCLLTFLRRKGAAIDDSLAALVKQKNLLISQFRDIATEDEVTAQEIRDKLMAKFEPLWVGRG